MKIIIAPDSYKNALSAPETAAALARGWKKKRPQDEICVLPLSDGGEGSCRTAMNFMPGGKLHPADTVDPLMRRIKGEFGVSGSTGVLEMASASGLELLDEKEYAPLDATTFGTGILIREMIEKFSIRELVLGIGGSATTDCGAGMLQALGAKFYDAGNHLLKDGIGGGQLGLIKRMDLSICRKLLKNVKIKIACDVTNPLLGERGCAAVYSPQKGAAPQDVKILEENLSSFESLCRTAGLPAGNSPGDGAAGGMGYALRAILGGTIQPGAELMMDLANINALLPGADFVLTGEGCSDEQTLQGKLCAAVALRAARFHVPTILCSGAIRSGADELQKLFAGVFSISRGPCPLDQAIRETGSNLEMLAASIAGLFLE